MRNKAATHIECRTINTVSSDDEGFGDGVASGDDVAFGDDVATTQTEFRGSGWFKCGGSYGGRLLVRRYSQVSRSFLLRCIANAEDFK